MVYNLTIPWQAVGHNIFNFTINKLAQNVIRILGEILTPWTLV